MKIKKNVSVHGENKKNHNILQLYAGFSACRLEKNPSVIIL